MMKLFRYIFFIVLMVVGFNSIEVMAQASPYCKSSVSSTNGANSICSGSSLLLWYGDTSSGKKVYQWFTGSHPNLVKINGATKPQLLINSGNTYYVRVVDTSVSYTATSDTGYCFRTITENIQPQTSFTFTPNSGCGTTPVKFTYTGTNASGFLFDWNFGDISFNQSSLVNPTHTYTPSASGAATNYIVTLIVKNANSTCYDTTKHTIVVGSGPDAKLDESNTINYEGKVTFKDCTGGNDFNFTFNNNSSTSASSISNYKIDWGDGQPVYSSNSFTTTSHLYSIGLYTLKYIVTGNNGCVNTKEYFVFVGTNPAVGFGNPGNTDVCTGTSLTFPITSVGSNPPGTTYTIHYNDGSIDSSFDTYPPPLTVTHMFTTSSCGVVGLLGETDAFFAKITAANPCKTTSGAVGGIVISLKPKVFFSSNLLIDTTCVNSSITFNNNSNIATIPYSSSNCNSGNIVWDIQPSTGWNIVAGTLGNGVNINPTSWTSGSNIISINFSVAGTYTIKLKGSGFNTKCGYDSLVKTICVNPTPTSSFSLTRNSICLGDTATAISTTSTPLCGKTTYQWTISYAAISGCVPPTSNAVYTIGSDTSANPQFRFNNPGIYTISLVTGIKGISCTSTSSSQTITVKGKPNISINNIASVCQGENIAPTAVTPTCYISSATYNWAFAGGVPATSNTLNPGTIKMDSSGINKVVSLSATNECGITTTQTTVTIKPIPSISSAIPHNPSQCTLLNGSIDLTGLINGTTYTITYTKNGGTPTTITKVAAGGMVTITGLGSGVYDNIKVSIVGDGCFSNAVGPVSLSDPNPPATPTVGSNSPLCSGATLNLTASTTTTGTIVYAWSGPSGFTSAAQSPTKSNITVSANGTYSVTATLAGCTSAAGTVAVVVNQTPATPTANYTNPICSGATLNLTANTTTSGTIDYAWTGPNSFVSTIQNPTIATVTTAANGSYNVIATATPSNCASTAGTVNVTINPTPNISTSSFRNPTSCGGTDGKIILEGLAFNTSYSVIYTKGATTITPFSLTSNSSGVLTITGLSAGTYTNVSVTLNGCPSNTVGSFILVDPNPPATPVITAVANICSGKNLTLSAATSTSGTATYNWTSPNGFSATGTPVNINNIPTKLGGTYNVTVTINGCTSSAGTAVIAVDSTPLAPVITGNTSICSDSTLKLTASTISSGTMTYNWTVPVGSFTNTATVTINNVTSANAGTYSVTATSSANCVSANGTTNVTVNPTPIISGLTFKNPTACATATGSISFNVIPATGSYTVKYKKNGFDLVRNITPIGGIITIDTLRAGNYTSITVTAASGCPSNILAGVILVDPNPPATPVIAAVPNVCSGKNLVINVTSPIVGATYNWTSTSGFNGMGATVNLTNVPTKLAGTYSVTVTDSGCVSNAGSVVVAIDSTPAAPIITGNTSICSDSTLKLTASTISSGTMTYNWTVPVGSFTNTPNVVINNVTAANAGTYSVTATSSANCVSANGTTNVTINPTPIISGLTFKNPTACATATGSISFNVTPASGNYVVNYIKDGANFSRNITATSGIITIDTLRAGNYTSITVTAASGCPSNILTGAILVDPNPPATPIIAAVPNVCSGKNLVINVTSPIVGATYNWTSTSGFNGVGATINIANVPTKLAGTFSVTVTDSGCVSNAGSVVVAIDSTPAMPTITGNTSICSDSTLKLTASTISSGTMTYNWTVPVGSFTNTATVTINNVTSANAGTYSVTATSTINANCISPIANTNIIVYQSPTLGVKDSTNPNQCATPTGFINLNGLNPNTSYNIFYTINASVKMQTQTSDASGVVKLDTLRAGTYSNIYVTLNGCPSKPVRTITLNDPTPPATPIVTAVDSICSGENLTLHANTTSSGVATYQWSSVNGFNQTGATVSINNISTNAGGQYSVTATINNCTSLAGIKNVRVDSTPVKPIIVANSPVCSDSAIKLQCSTVSPGNMNYSWTGVNSFISNLQNPTIINAQTINDGNYSVFVTSEIGACLSQTTTQYVIVNPSPNVAQVNDTTYKDGSNSGNIIFAGTVANTTFNWTNSNPTIGLPATGTGTINFNANNTTPFVVSGLITVTPATTFCIGKPISFTIYVNPTPTLSSPLKDTICTDVAYNYQAASSTPSVKYTWSRSVVAGISNTPSASTDSTGSINETLINTTALPIDVTYQFKLYSLGSVNTVPFVLTVNPNAKALYTFANDKLCTPALIDTTNIKTQDFSIANGAYQWYANGSLIGTGIHFPGYTIANNGDTVYIKLIAISAFGCKADSFEHKFYTVKTPTVSFTKSIAKGCGPLTVSFVNNSTPLTAPAYHWDFGNGQTSTQITPADVTFIADTSYNRHDTTYYITLTAITQCDTIKYLDSVTVLPKPKALFQPDTTVGCSVFHFAAFNNSLGTHNTYVWDFGDSTALVTDTLLGYYYHNFYTAKTDTFNVKLTATNACGVDSGVVKIVVFPNSIVPKIIVDGNNNFGCAPTQIRFVNNTIGASKFTMNFGDFSPPYLSTKNPDTVYHTFNAGGNYIVTLKAENSCTDSTVSLTLQLFNKPQALFSLTPNQFCRKELVSFKNLSDTALSFEWWFGDGVTSTDLHPTHRYLAAGNFIVTLIAKSTNPTGSVCTDTIRKNIVIRDLPISSFTDNAAIQNCQPYNFVGSTIQPIGNIENWIFSDPYSTDTTQAGNVGNHIFYHTGVFTVRMIVYNPYGCSDTSSTTVKVIETPKPLFTMSDTISCTPGKAVNFFNNTTYSAADAVNYQWYVNGVLTATTKNFTTNFTASPNITTAVKFSIKLIAINSFGCKDSITKYFTIIPKAQPSFAVNALQGCVPFNLQINNASQYANIFKWYLDGNLFSVIAAPAPITLTIPATTYTIKLVADHSLGCGADSVVKQVSTYTKPIANFQIPVRSSCSGKLSINCFDLSSVVGANIKKWYWAFGDGTNDTARNPTHTYNIPGRFTVSLIVQDDRGCSSDYSSQIVTNFGKPNSKFAIGNACINNPAIPVNLSTPGFGSSSITSYLWNFGDGTFLTGIQPIHIYLNQGTYTVTLITTTDSSCVADTFSQQITVYGKPTANFTVSNNCVNENAMFTNTSLFGYMQTAVGTSEWNFGDGITDNNLNASHIYKAIGDYSVKLTVTGNRCPNLVDSVRKIATIYQPRNSVVYPRINGVRGTPIQLTALNGGVSYNWNPITGLNNSAAQNPIATYPISTPNVINYTISITDSLGCKVKDKQEVWLFVDADIFLPTAFTPNGDGANDVFKPLYVNISRINYFRVYNRWGKVVFETNDMSKHWDGKINGALLPMDTYTWIVGGYTNDGKEITRNGNVTMILNQ